jgi:hypothetical protein
MLRYNPTNSYADAAPGDVAVQDALRLLQIL